MKVMMDALNLTMHTDKRFLTQAAYAGNNNQGSNTPKPKETNMSILKIWHDHRQWMIKPSMRKY